MTTKSKTDRKLYKLLCKVVTLFIANYIEKLFQDADVPQDKIDLVKKM